MIILGLGGILKDAAAALLRDGELVAAIEEKKIARRWTPGALPLASMAECMRLASASAAEVNYVAIAQPVATGALIHAQLRSLFPNASSRWWSIKPRMPPPRTTPRVSTTPLC